MNGTAQYTNPSVMNTAYMNNTAVMKSQASLLDINTASADDFAKLSGINGIQVKKIIQYRESHGQFQSVDEFLQIVNMPINMKERLRLKVICGKNGATSKTAAASQNSTAPANMNKHNGHGRTVDF